VASERASARREFVDTNVLVYLTHGQSYAGVTALNPFWEPNETS
jgi:predicted nucleic acid-binding protein